MAFHTLTLIGKTLVVKHTVLSLCYFEIEIQKVLDEYARLWAAMSLWTDVGTVL